MKLMLVVVQHSDANRLQDALNQADYRHTKLASTGGFLREGNTTFLLGVKDDEVWYVKEIIKKTCQQRTRVMPTDHSFGDISAGFIEPMEVVVGGAVVFVLPLDEMIKF